MFFGSLRQQNPILAFSGEKNLQGSYCELSVTDCVYQTRAPWHFLCRTHVGTTRSVTSAPTKGVPGRTEDSSGTESSSSISDGPVSRSELHSRVSRMSSGVPLVASWMGCFFPAPILCNHQPNEYLTFPQPRLCPAKSPGPVLHDPLGEGVRK